MRLLRFAAVIFAAALTLSSCSKKEKKQNRLIGEWNIVSLSTKSAVIGSQTVDVYLSFDGDGTFVIYQKTSDAQQYYSKFSGTWSLSGSVLSGFYADGSKLANDYDVTVSDGNLTLASKSTPSEVSVFKKAVIPDNVKSTAREID